MPQSNHIGTALGEIYLPVPGGQLPNSSAQKTALQLMTMRNLPLSSPGSLPQSRPPSLPATGTQPVGTPGGSGSKNLHHRRYRAQAAIPSPGTEPRHWHRTRCRSVPVAAAGSAGRIKRKTSVSQKIPRFTIRFHLELV